jgi:gliding motility-associated protein GldC
MSTTIKQSEIRFKITLDPQNVPTDIKWQATDSKSEELRDCKSIMLSIWDAAQQETLKIDLWTNEMTIDEMHSHYFQTLLAMTDSYQKATGNPIVKEEMKKFAAHIARLTADWENSKSR